MAKRQNIKGYDFFKNIEDREEYKLTAAKEERNGKERD
jgi:hypothetical protein